MLAVSPVSFPQDSVAGTPFTLLMADGSNIVRTGIDPGSGRPVVWTTYVLSTPMMVARRFLVVEDNARDIPASSVHRGMWWEANRTFHLFELFEEQPGPNPVDFEEREAADTAMLERTPLARPSWREDPPGPEPVLEPAYAADRLECISFEVRTKYGVVRQTKFIRPEKIVGLLTAEEPLGEFVRYLVEQAFE